VDASRRRYEQAIRKALEDLQPVDAAQEAHRQQLKRTAYESSLLLAVKEREQAVNRTSERAAADSISA